MKSSCTGLKILSLISALLLCIGSAAQMTTGGWRACPAYHNAEKCVKAFSRIYVLSDGALYSYSPEDNSIQTYDKVTALSDNEIADIVYCPTEKAVLIAYSNGNVDFLYSDDDIYNMTDLKNSSLQDRTVNEVKIYGKTAYLSTGSGIVTLDITKKEISGTYKFTGVYSTLVHDGYIVCASESGIWKGRMSDNLADGSKWQRIEDRSIFRELLEFDGRVAVHADNRGLYYIDLDTGILEKIRFDVLETGICDGRLFTYLENRLIIYNTDKSQEKYDTDFRVNDLLFDGNNVWLCCGDKGLQRCSFRDGRIVIGISSVIPDSPRRNYFDFMSISDDGKLLVAGGSLNYSGIDYEGTVMYYADNRWTNFEEDSISEITGLDYINITSVVEDPKKAGHYYAGSARHGLYEFQDGRFTKLYSLDNSPLRTILPDDINPYDYVSVDGLQYDMEGNLWMFNNEVDTIFRILKPDGQWTSLYYPEIAGLPTFKHILFDSNGLVWAPSVRFRPGIFCIDTNGTLEDTSDDRHSFSGANFTNQDGVTITVNNIYFIEEDLDGILWIGTDQGIFTLDKPRSFLSETAHTFNRVKVPKNDGTNYADYLLSNVFASAICIDYGNRKWIGTYNNGIFLIDRDNITTLHHFTTDNSPLISDNIISIKLNGDTGELFIGTDKGLVIFGSDAVRPQETLQKSNVTVYPNPLLPEHEDMITVKGLSNDCTVKILNQSGHVIHQGISNGGAYSWNCRQGKRRVASGVYFVMAVNEDGTSGIVSRFVIFR